MIWTRRRQTFVAESESNTKYSAVVENSGDESPGRAQVSGIRRRFGRGCDGVFAIKNSCGCHGAGKPSNRYQGRVRIAGTSRAVREPSGPLSERPRPRHFESAHRLGSGESKTGRGARLWTSLGSDGINAGRASTWLQALEPLIPRLNLAWKSAAFRD